MLSVDVITQAEVNPARAYAAHLGLRGSVCAGGRPAVLHGVAFADRIVSLGRYHLAPERRSEAGVRLHRRVGGGRVAPLGPGFALVELILPHRSALVSSDPRALRPEQCLNRFARAVLAGLRGFGIDAFYPGRDVLTVDRRLLAQVSMQCGDDGAAVFELVLTLDSDWTVLPDWVAALDEQGLIAAERLGSERVTALARHVAHVPSLDELAHALGGALASEFGVEPRGSALGAEERAPADHESWLLERRPRPELDRRALAWGQLGAFEVHASIEAGLIGDIMLSGDFIADAPSIARLEKTLRGRPPRRDALLAAVRSVYDDPDAFVFGLGHPADIADALARIA
jgi:hypothetical protein